jgi:hypothetical protein
MQLSYLAKLVWSKCFNWFAQRQSSPCVFNFPLKTRKCLMVTNILKGVFVLEMVLLAIVLVTTCIAEGALAINASKPETIDICRGDYYSATIREKYCSVSYHSTYLRRRSSLLSIPAL